MTYISSILSIEPEKIANVNYGTSLQNEPFNTYAETFDDTSKGVGIYGIEGSDGSGPVGGRHILQCILFFCIISNTVHSYIHSLIFVYLR